METTIDRPARRPVPNYRLPYFDAALGCYRVPLGTNGKTALIDAIDADRVAAYAWNWVHDPPHSRPRNGTAYRYQSEGTTQFRVALHRFILDAASGIEVSFKDGDGLNCRRENLLTLTHAQAVQRSRKWLRRKTSEFKGVSWDKTRRRWMAAIGVDGRHLHLGRFRDERLAAETYDKAATEHFGSMAWLNFPNPK